MMYLDLIDFVTLHLRGFIKITRIDLTEPSITVYICAV